MVAKNVRHHLFGSALLLSIGCAFLTGAPVPPVESPTPGFSPTPSLSQTASATATASPSATKTAAPTRTKKPSRTLTPTSLPAVSVAPACRSGVDGFDRLKRSLKIPDHFEAGEPYRKPGDFDPNAYFSVLTHLQMETGYVLDYVYFSDELGGKPMLYARPAGNDPFRSYEEFLQSLGEEFSGERSYEVLPHAFDYLEQVRADGSPEGFFQFDFLALLGDQFYLSWHALYNDFIVLCETADAQRVADSLRNATPALSAEDLEKIKGIDYRSTVAVNPDTVTVRMVVFSKWGGFFENVYTSDRANPARLLNMEQNVFVPYDCGISF